MDDSDIDAPGSSILDAPTRDSFDFQSSRIDRSRARAAADILIDITDDVQQVTVGKLRVCHNFTFILHFADNCS